ncbi:MAG TPA: hypothetical protein VMF12_19390 [Xanthobacteraceae bacterium]|nr:hypothetical protein [Xanthobacteraceae bacterium]HUC64579.1 hypothetical protein [Stellaceae bacterium]
MAPLTSAARKRLAARAFAGPGRSFPIQDKKHARLAISGATRSQHAGNISAAEADRIRTRARAKLAKKRSGRADGKKPGIRADKSRRR